MAGARRRIVVADCDKKLLATAYAELTRIGCDVVGLCDNGPDAFAMISELEPDIVLTNVFLREADGFRLMERIRRMPFESMPAVAMMVPLKRADLVKRVKDAGAFAAIDIPTLPIDLVYAVQSAKPMDRMIPCYAREERIREILDRMSLNRELKGYEYLVTAIGIACRSHKFYRAMTTVVYPETARAHGATATGVERCIRHALDTAWMRGDLEKQYAYFGNTIDESRGKPTNSEFIARVTEALRLEAM